MFTVVHDGEEYAINHVRSSDITYALNDIPELNLVVANKENNPAYPYLVDDAILNIEGHEWRIRAKTSRSAYKNIKGLHIVMDLEEMPFTQLLTGSYSVFDLLNIVLDGTGFDFILYQGPGELEPVYVENFGRTSVWSAFKQVTQAAGLDFRVEKGRMLFVAKEIGFDYGNQFRYGYNVRNLAENTDSTDVVTHVIVFYGEEYEHEALFISPTASNYDRPFYGEIIKDSRILYPDAAAKRAAEEFKDIDISYEIDCMQTNTVYQLGEIIHTLYEPLDDLDITTRVLKEKYSWNGEEYLLSTVTVGNYIFKTEGDIIQDLIDKNKKDSEDKLDEAKKQISIRFEETEQIIEDQYTTITAEYASAITISAQALTSDYNAKFTTVQEGMVTMEQTLSSSIEQTAGEIRTSVSDLTVTVDGHGTRISSAESSISQQAGQITQKVSYTEYTGETIVSKIEQTAAEVTISAAKINFVGHVFGESSTWSGNISTDQNAYVGNDLYLGQNSLSGKMIRFSTGINITSDNAGTLSISSIRTDIVDGTVNIGESPYSVFCGGYWDFSGANVSNLAANTVGPFHFAYETAGKLAVYRYGSKLGDLTLN